MKKLIAITIILSICLTFVGCTVTNSENATDISKETVEVTTNITEEFVSDIPNAKKFDEMAWPTFGLATEIPIPEWSNCGEILVDGETTFWAQIGYSTLDDFNDYITVCQDAGFTEDCCRVSEYLYYGANADGHAVQLTYNQFKHYIAIQATTDADGWDKYWEA